MDQQKRNRLWPLWLLLPLGTVYYFCKFVLPGYSFTALVCLCLAALILFYVAMPFLGQRFPKTAKLLTRCVTAVLIVGLLICGVTEAIIIRASFGSPDRERYLHIVEELAKQYGVELDPRQLAVRSEAFAVRSGGRSARVAKQFIELCKAAVFS